MEGVKESKNIHGREWFLSLCFTHTSMDAPLSPPFPFSLHFSRIYSSESLLEEECKLNTEWGGEREEYEREKGRLMMSDWGGGWSKDG